MRIAFYKAFQPKGTWVDKFVAIGTLSKYSHTENIFPDGMSYSISPREKCARFKKLKFNPERWDFLDVPATDIEISEMRKDAESRIKLNIEYDFKGAFFSGFMNTLGLNRISNICIEDKEKIFCSEESARLLKMHVKEFKDMQTQCHYFPGKLYNYISNLHFNRLTRFLNFNRIR